jgi:hypothetical protein
LIFSKDALHMRRIFFDEQLCILGMNLCLSELNEPVPLFLLSSFTGKLLLQNNLPHTKPKSGFDGKEHFAFGAE